MNDYDDHREREERFKQWSIRERERRIKDHAAVILAGFASTGLVEGLVYVDGKALPAIKTALAAAISIEDAQIPPKGDTDAADD